MRKVCSSSSASLAWLWLTTRLWPEDLPWGPGPAVPVSQDHASFPLQENCNGSSWDVIYVSWSSSVVNQMIFSDFQSCATIMIIHYFHVSRDCLVPLTVNLCAHPLPQATTDLLSVSADLAFWEISHNEIIQHGVIGVWPFSHLALNAFRFLSVVCISSSFLLIAE